MQQWSNRGSGEPAWVNASHECAILMRDPIRGKHEGQRSYAPRQQAGQMTAPDQPCIDTEKPLPSRRRPQMTHFTVGILSAHKARVAPWCGATTSGTQRCERGGDRGLRWGKSAPRRALRRSPDTPYRASRRAYPDEPICRHEMGQYPRPLVLPLRYPSTGRPHLDPGAEPSPAIASAEIRPTVNQRTGQQRVSDSSVARNRTRSSLEARKPVIRWPED